MEFQFHRMIKSRLSLFIPRRNISIPLIHGINRESMDFFILWN
jgi:hypothetical protein